MKACTDSNNPHFLSHLTAIVSSRRYNNVSISIFSQRIAYSSIDFHYSIEQSNMGLAGIQQGRGKQPTITRACDHTWDSHHPSLYLPRRSIQDSCTGHKGWAHPQQCHMCWEEIPPLAQKSPRGGLGEMPETDQEEAWWYCLCQECSKIVEEVERKIVMLIDFLH